MGVEKNIYLHFNDGPGSIIWNFYCKKFEFF